jgi:hypothetical protein
MGIECRPGEVETVDHAQKRIKALEWACSVMWWRDR